MELRLFGQEQMADYMLNYFIQPEGIDLFNVLPKIYVCRDTKEGGYTLKKTISGRITATSNPKTEVSSRIPLSLVRFFWKNASKIHFEEKTGKINEDDLFEARIIHSAIIAKILKPENEYFRRELIAILKILATPPDFPIIFKELVVLPGEITEVKKYKRPHELFSKKIA